MGKVSPLRRPLPILAAMRAFSVALTNGRPSIEDDDFSRNGSPASPCKRISRAVHWTGTRDATEVLRDYVILKRYLEIYEGISTSH